MQRNLKKMWPAVAASLVAFTNLLSADATNNSAQMRNLENRVSALEQRRGTSGMINPPGRPQVKCGADLFIFGDLIYWNSHENGLSYAIVNHGTSANLANAKVKNIHGKWNWGFRVGAGYNIPHDGWDVRLTWLRFTDNGIRHANFHDGNVVFPVKVNPADPISVGLAGSSARSHWRMTLNQLDLDLGREFFVSKWLTLRPHGGLRTDWLHQKWANTFRNFINSDGGPINKVFTEDRDHWWGMGLEAGLDTQWGFGAGWSLFGDVTAAIIYGFHDFHIKEKDSPAISRSLPDGVFIDLDNSYRVSHPVLDVAAGVRYDCMFSDDRFHVGLQLGWEHHIYFSQNQFPYFTDDAALGAFVRNQGDLTLQGWTFEARFDF